MLDFYYGCTEEVPYTYNKFRLLLPKTMNTKLDTSMPTCKYKYPSHKHRLNKTKKLLY